MEKILKQWNKRSLSPIGKITLIKTLVIPIFNLLSASLPNPDVKIYETINKTLYNFVWNENPKIKKKNSCDKEVYRRRIEYDNLNAFVSALKSTWIRRLLLNESKWQEIKNIYIYKSGNVDIMSCRIYSGYFKHIE